MEPNQFEGDEIGFEMMDIDLQEIQVKYEILKKLGFQYDPY